MKLILVRVRGTARMPPKAKETLKSLKLERGNSFAIVEEEKVKGMLMIIAPYVTWGPLTDEALKVLNITPDGKKKIMTLNSPKNGFGRKGIKMPFSKGGALGDRGEKITDLIQRMTK